MISRDDMWMTEFEARMTRWLGEQQAKENAKRPGTLGKGCRTGEADGCIRARRTELACSVIVNVYWRPCIIPPRMPDCGGTIEVRATRECYKTRWLTIKAEELRKAPDMPYVLVMEIKAGVHYRALGWAFARDAQPYELIKDGQDLRYRILAEDLRPMSELREWLRDHR